MKINILLHENTPKGYTATVWGWPSLVINGKTKNEALTRVRKAVKDRLSKSEFVTLDIDDELADPWVKFAGMWENDPTFDDFLQEVAACRRQIDEEDRV